MSWRKFSAFHSAFPGCCIAPTKQGGNPGFFNCLYAFLDQIISSFTTFETRSFQNCNDDDECIKLGPWAGSTWTLHHMKSKRKKGLRNIHKMSTIYKKKRGMSNSKFMIPTLTCRCASTSVNVKAIINTSSIQKLQTENLRLSWNCFKRLNLEAHL